MDRDRINIDLPFFKLHVDGDVVDISGLGSFADQDNDDPEVREARRRARRIASLIRHIALFAVVIAFLAAVDGLTGGGWWVHWVALVWGGIIALQLLGGLFGGILGRGLEERLFERELRRRP